MRLTRLENILQDEPGYRRKQVREALYKQLISSWGEATCLPLSLRKRLDLEVPLETPGEMFAEPDNTTVRLLQELSDHSSVEAVLMKHTDGRNTVCVSSHTGCTLGCLFCATAELPVSRGLSSGEILGQVLAFSRFLARQEKRVNNVVFMGMGEPLLNYDQVMAAVNELVSPDGLDLAARRISISTAGIVPGIMKLASQPLQVNLAVSLHAPNDKLRSRLMPINRRYPLGRLIPAVRDYIHASGRKVMIEYILLDKVNDRPDDARELASLLRDGLGRLFFVNLIRANPAREFQPSPALRLQRFREILEARSIRVSVRSRFGVGVGGACGQLAGKKQDSGGRKKDERISTGKNRAQGTSSRRGPHRRRPGSGQRT